MKGRERRTVVITGGTGGIGFQSALGIAETGARVLITGRNRERGEAARQRIVDETGNEHVELVVGDVSSIEGIDALAHALIERVQQIDVLVNNAGYMGNAPDYSVDGLEPEGVSVNVLFPGRASTAMTGSMSPKALPGAMKLMYPLMRLLFRDDDGKSATKAAHSTIWGATSPALDGVTGRYFDTNSKEQRLHPTAYDTQVQHSILVVIDTATGPSSPQH